jgi:hypothetical protein
MTQLVYVSAFLDIGRESWKEFKRTYSDYLNSFQPILNLFLKANNEKFKLLLFLDSKYDINIKHPNIFIIPINEAFMQTLPLWKKLDRETSIINSKMYKDTFAHRLCYPENSNPKYTLINHCKIDFICKAMEYIDCEYYCWIDFGYCKNLENIPTKFLDLNKLDKDKIIYTLINPLDDNDQDIMYTMLKAPEKIGGFFFFGNKVNLIKYQKLYHCVHRKFQENNIVDDDQHLALRCYFENRDMFKLYTLGWHKALKHFQI